MRLSMVVLGWSSLPGHSPDWLGISPTNTMSTSCALVPQFAIARTLWELVLQLGASNSTCAFQPRLACNRVFNLFRSHLVDGKGSRFNRAGM